MSSYSVPNPLVHPYHPDNLSILYLNYVYYGFVVVNVLQNNHHTVESVCIIVTFLTIFLSIMAACFKLSSLVKAALNVLCCILAPSCGGRLYGNAGVLQSPKFKQLYPFTITCTWVLEVGPSSNIDIQLTASFHNEDCKSSLLFRDGLSYNSSPIKIYCKNTTSSFISKGSTLYIEHKIEQNTESTFLVNWFERTKSSFKGL